MPFSIRGCALFFLLLLLALSGCAGEEAEGASVTLIWGGTHEVGEGSALPGDVFMTDGWLRLAPGARLEGDLTMLGGALESAGAIGGDVLVLGGAAAFAGGGSVEGNLDYTSGAVVEMAPGVVQGQVTERLGSPDTDAFLRQDETGVDDFLRALISYLVLAAAGAFLAVRRPALLARVAEAATQHPLVGGAVGLLSGLVAPALLVLMAFTVVLLPVTTVGLILAVLVVGYAQMALGWAAGQWLARRRGWAAGRATFAGTLALLVALWLLRLIPVAGDLLAMLVTLVAVGAVLLTRFGTVAYQPPLPRPPEDLSSYARPSRRN